MQDPQQAEFAGDNFIRYTGDVKQFSESQLYEITAQEIGSDIHMNALPTLTAKVSKPSASVTQNVTPCRLMESSRRARNLPMPPRSTCCMPSTSPPNINTAFPY